MGRSGIAGAQRRRRSLQRLFEQLQSQFWRRWFWRRRLRRWRSLQRRRFWWWRFSRRGWRGLGRSLWRRRLWGRRLPWWWWVRGTALIPCSTAIMGRVARPRASYCWQRGLADESGSAVAGPPPEARLAAWWTSQWSAQCSAQTVRRAPHAEAGAVCEMLCRRGAASYGRCRSGLLARELGAEAIRACLGSDGAERASEG